MWKKAQKTPPPYETEEMSKEDKKFTQQVIRSFLCHGRAVDITTLKALNSLTVRQAKPTENAMKATKHFLDHMATHPSATIRHHPSDMTLQTHLDASFMNESKACSTAGGHHFLGKNVRDNQPMFLNGAMCSLC